MYTIAKTFFTTRQGEEVGKKEFLAVALDLNDEIFIGYIVFLPCLNLSLKIYLSYKV